MAKAPKPTPEQDPKPKPETLLKGLRDLLSRVLIGVISVLSRVILTKTFLKHSLAKSQEPLSNPSPTPYESLFKGAL